ncbi:MAG: type II secretion system protein GspJ [Myxococcota bacterium]|nr:type II secretion system protein GspJ [Myxococcota bacterium]
MMFGSRRGLTLIEIIVALAIMAMIGSIAAGTLGTSIQALDAIEEAGGSTRTARIALRRITRALELTHLTKNKGAVNTYKTVFVGRDDGDEDQLWFATLAHHRKIRDSRQCDQTEITLFLDDDPDQDDAKVLYIRESPRIDQEPDKGGRPMPLARGVTRFDLRYLDGVSGEWKDEWDTESVETPYRLPRAVQIVLELTSPDPNSDDDDDFITQAYVRTVMLAMAAPQVKSVFAKGGNQ